MKKILLILSLVFLPTLVYGSTAGDFIVNRQSTYDIPDGTNNILVLDLTLPAPPEGETYQLKTISLHNSGTADHTVISKLEIWEDGESRGWDNDETEGAIILKAPFFDTAISGNFKAYSKNDPWRRIFVTIDLESGFINEKILKFQLLKNSVVFTNSAVSSPSDIEITGLERIVRHDASVPVVPASPIAKNGEALSTSSIRWYFTDLSNNEFGFKILDGNLNEVARKEEDNLSYLDETGLFSNTEYSGRRVVAFNDRGENLSSNLAVFSAVQTLVEEEIEEIVKEEIIEEIEEVKETVQEEPSLFEKIQTKIADIQQQISDFIKQLDEFIKQSSATVFSALQGFLRAFFGK